MSVLHFLGEPCQGTIKSFVLGKRYGFISGDEFSEDVFVNYKLCPNLEEYGDNLCAGSRVTFVPMENASKKGSFEAQSCELVDGGGVSVDPGASIGKWVDCTVKSWVPSTGWGFLTSKKANADIMVSKRLCPKLNTFTLQQGLIVRAKFVESKSKPGSLEATDVEPKMGNSSMGMGMQPELGQMFMKFLNGGSMWGMGDMGGMGYMGGMQGSTGQRLTGTVKSFVDTKGYGFITCDRVQGDIFISNKTSPGVQELLESAPSIKGASVQFILANSKSTPGAYEATNVSLVSTSFGPVKGGRKTAGTPGPYASQKTKKFIGQTVTGSIKSFFAGKGWGFVNSDSFADDCFFNIKLNPHLSEVAEQLQAGTPVSFTVQQNASRPGALEAVDIEV